MIWLGVKLGTKLGANLGAKLGLNLRAKLGCKLGPKLGIKLCCRLTTQSNQSTFQIISNGQCGHPRGRSMTQTFNIENFRKPSPLYWTLVVDGRERTEATFQTEDAGHKAFTVAKRKRVTHSATLWRHNTDNGSCVKVEDFDRGIPMRNMRDFDRL